MWSPGATRGSRQHRAGASFDRKCLPRSLSCPAELPSDVGDTIWHRKESGLARGVALISDGVSFAGYVQLALVIGSVCLFQIRLAGCSVSRSLTCGSDMSMCRTCT